MTLIKRAKSEARRLMIDNHNQSPTEQLQAWRDGDNEAFEKVISLLYQDLKRIAQRQLYQGKPGATLNATALVHETYLKLVSQGQVECQNRGHFLNIVARAMRHIIIDHARRRQADKRGGDQVRVPLGEADAAINQEAEPLLTLDQALTRLSDFDARLGFMVEYRFFAGLTEDETAEVLGLSKSTVQRDWIRAKAWLRHEIGSRDQET